MSSVDNQNQVNGSTFVTVLAWIFIVFGGLATLMAVAQNILISTMPPFGEMSQQIAQEQGGVPAPAKFMFNNVRLIFAGFLVLSAVTLVSAIGLLRRRNWARLILIALLALGIVWNVGSVLFLQYTMIQSAPPSALNVPEGVRAQMEAMENVMLVFSSVMAIGFAILFAWIIKRLVSPSVTREFRTTRTALPDR